jgi:5-methylcytosine-specific restriction endonuclease McrA
VTPLRRKTRLSRTGRLKPASARTRAGVSRYRAWALDVKARDQCCVKCGFRELLEAHHVYPKGKYPELRLVLENGLTLCWNCHKSWHSSSRAWREWWEVMWPARAELIRGLLRAS